MGRSHSIVTVVFSHLQECGSGRGLKPQCTVPTIDRASEDGSMNNHELLEDAIVMRILIMSL